MITQIARVIASDVNSPTAAQPPLGVPGGTSGSIGDP